MTNDELKLFKSKLVSVQEQLTSTSKTITDFIHEEILPRLNSVTVSEQSKVNTFTPNTKPKGDPLAELMHNMSQADKEKLVSVLEENAPS